jgi:tRNA dimethylallyltransferase
LSIFDRCVIVAILSLKNLLHSMMQPFFIGITGPTGVGKTALVEGLSEQLSFSIEVINADMGQLYTPLSVGTAKPDLETQTVPHHLFDCIDEPRDYTATQYRDAVVRLIHEITARGALPVIVGGSGFYLATLFYPPQEQARSSELEFSDKSTQELWDLLATVDPKRATQLHKHDRYRIVRALHVWYETGSLPSGLVPEFNPPGTFALYFLNRSKEDLHERINARVCEMFNLGWLDEVAGLSKEWHDYLLKKKLIGYPEIIAYLREQELGVADDAYEQLVEKISQRTRGYAKRQVTFWKSLEKRLRKSDPEGKYLKKIEEINLTLMPIDLYIKQLCTELEKLYQGSKGHGP